MIYIYIYKSTKFFLSQEELDKEQDNLHYKRKLKKNKFINIVLYVIVNNMIFSNVVFI